MKHRIALVWALSVWLITGAVPATATYMDLMDYPRLKAELGAAVPTGDGIQVMHVEAKEGNDYIPNADDPEFKTPDKSFTNVSGTSPGVSSHATTVGINFYGNDTSVAPDVGIDEAVLNYEAGDWLYSFLNFNEIAKPETTDARIANHSWLAGTGVPSIDGNILRRIDFTIEEDDLIQVAGAPNTGHEAPIFKDAYNEISVGLTNGEHVSGTTDVDTLYTDGRVAPTLVAPGFNKADDSTTFTSWATPMVSATAAMLLEVAQDASLSSGTITNRTRTIQHAETSEVIKAVLMAGADRAVDNPRGADLTDYTADTTNNLDSRYGAGQMNIYNAYRILATGEQESQQDGTGGVIEAFGWDYDPAFGGDAGSNDVGSYFFTPTTAWMLDRLQATLVWNLDVDIDVDIDPDKVEFTTAFYDLDLLLLDVTGGGTSLASSTSTEHNTENIFYEGLTLGNTYELRVVPKDGQGDFAWDYALAWQVPEPATLALLALGGLILFHRRRHLGRG